MSKKVSYHCDNCDCRIDYCDGEDDHINGIKIEGEIKISVHIPQQSGSSHFPVNGLSDMNFCSGKCFKAYVNKSFMNDLVKNVDTVDTTKTYRGISSVYELPKK